MSMTNTQTVIMQAKVVATEQQRSVQEALRIADKIVNNFHGQNLFPISVKNSVLWSKLI